MQKLCIDRVENGFVLTKDPNDDADPVVIEIFENAPLDATEDLLWEIIDYFGLSGNRYDHERIHITRKKGDKYEK